VLLNSALTAVFGKTVSAQNVAAELAQQTTAPADRSVYGECRATGTPAGVPVKGNYIYGAWILNSRVSDLSSFTLFLDKREVLLSGDAFDLSGAGAIPTEDPFKNHLNVWISRGNHTAPPAAFTTEAPYVEGTGEHLWKVSDAWQGRTVIWLKIKAGSNRSERWPSTPPLVEVEGRWSLICDPRNVLHDQDDPNTWEFSENHALCARDALMQNPIRRYRAGQIHDSFNQNGPDACDEVVALKSGGSEARYVCAGTVVWSEGEIEDQLNPMMISGAADFIRVGGKLGYAAGVYRAPEETLTYFLGSGFDFPDMVPGSELVNRLRVTYLSSGRGYETAELTMWDIPGALAADGGEPAVKTMDLPFCSSATQGMRVRNITGLRLRRQERIQGGTLPPEAFNLIGGSTTTIALPGPYGALDGIYEVETIHPGLSPLGEDGEVAMRLPASLVKHSADIYAWTPETDEEDVHNEEFVSATTGVGLPGPLSVQSGGDIDLNTGGALIPRFLFLFDPSTSDSVNSYEWSWRLAGGDYQTGGYVPSDTRNGDGEVFFYLNVAGIGEGHDVRVRAISTSGPGDWVELTGAIYSIALSDVTADAEPGRVAFAGTAPSNPLFFGLRGYRGEVGAGFDAAVKLAQVIPADAGEIFDVVVGDESAINILSNGDFVDGTGWTNIGNWAISGGVASHTVAAASSFLTQAVSGVESGTSIRFTVTLSGTTQGFFGARAVGDSVEQSLTTDNGVFSTFVLTPENMTSVTFVAGSAFDGTIDDVSAVVSTPNTIPLGQADYWLVPVTVSGAEGAPFGPFTLQIP
jgi:hypothetical protein